MTEYAPGAVRLRRSDLEPVFSDVEQQQLEQVADTPVKDLPATSQTSSRRMHNRKLDRGYKKLQLLRELALGEKTYRQLGEEYGVAHPSIWQFHQRNKEAVNEIRQNMDAEFAGIHLANKANRIMEYVTDIEEINAAEIVDGTLLARKHTAIKAIAEELGQLSQRVQVQQENKGSTRYEIVGVDLEKLR